MKFKVTCVRVNPEPSRNPFHAAAIHGKSNVTRRTWEFDATDEAEVRMFFSDAQKQRHGNVRGFEIENIEKVEQ